MEIRRSAWVLVMLTVVAGCGKKAENADVFAAAEGFRVAVNWEEVGEMVATLEKLGARVNWEEQEEGDPILEVDFSGTQITDEEMKTVARAFRVDEHFRVLYLPDTRVTDEGLKELSGLRSLRSLDLTNTGVTDAGVEALKDHKRLRWLSLWDTKVTDARRRELKRALPECKIEP